MKTWFFKQSKKQVQEARALRLDVVYDWQRMANLQSVGHAITNRYS